MNNASTIDQVQEWYVSNCDGDWEHTYGIKIETLDNPGWQVLIDLTRTSLELTEFGEVRIERTPQDWYTCRKANNQFAAACGPKNLDEVLALFLAWTRAARG